MLTLLGICATVLLFGFLVNHTVRAADGPILDSALWTRRYPQSGFLLPRRTNRSSISSDFLGRPRPRFPLPSYFCAISRRCQASRVSGVTIVATSRRSFLPTPLALAANRRKEEQHIERLQSAQCEHFHSEEIRSHHDGHVGTDKVFPACALSPFRGRWNIMPLENIADRLI